MTTLPATPTLSLAPGSDTGLSHSDDITSDTSPVITGTAAPNTVVTLTDANSTLALTTRADKNGNFEFVLSGLDAGLHTLSALATDAAGNFSDPSAPLNLDIETEATATSTAAAVPQTATSVTFAVHFDQPVSTISPTSFVLATTGTAFGNVTSVSGSGQDYTVTATGLGGEGTVGLAFSAYTPTDEAGNQVALTSSVGHDVADTTTPTTTLVSSDQFGVAGTGGDPAISGGGRVVAFISDDPNLIPSISTIAGAGNVYVKDTQTGAITLVTNGNDQTFAVQISLDGTVVAFSSAATNLVPGGTPEGELNLYTAQLTSVLSAGGLSFVPGSIKLVGTLDSNLSDGVNLNGFALSGDGSTLAFGTDAELPGGAGAGENSYTYNLATGAYTLIPNATGAITSISLDGTEVAYTGDVAVPGTGGQPDPEFGGDAPPDLIQDAFVYNSTTKATTTIDGSNLLPGTTPPTGIDQTAGYLTAYPVITGNGNTVVFQLIRTDGLSSLFSVNLNNPNVFTPISPGAGTDGSGDYDSDQSVSLGGGVVAYIDSDPSGITAEIYSAAGTATSSLGPALEAVLATQGNAVAITDYSDDTQTAPAVYEVSLGVSASIAPIDGNDTVDKTDLAQAVASGLTVSGTSNAPAGSPVLLYVTSATAAGNSDPFTTAVGDDGQWTATLPEEIASALTDGYYFLVVQVSDANGASPQVRRLFTVDTVAPTAPTAPVLDQGSNTGGDGVDTKDTTPTLDGLTEAGAFVTLYDVTGGGQVQLATATADENGVYTLTSSALADGTHVLAVQAQDAAGNTSPLSAAATIKVDTVPPLKPSAPALAPGQDDAALVEDTVAVSTPVLVGSTEPGDTITLYDGSTAIGSVKAASDGSYTIKAPTLADGDHSLTVVATDPAGNVGPASDPLDLTVDSVAPGAPQLGSVNGTTLSDGGLAPDFTVTGVAAAGTTVTLQVDGVTMEADSADTRASGAYTISVTDLSPGAHTLTVTATDGAGNTSQPSTATTVTISALGSGVPGPSAINGVLLDGPIAGATVFADANGNGVLDAGESSAATTTSGQYTLANPSGELIATGGIDSQTGLALPGAFTAPSGSVVIDPLTTLLDAYAAATGQTAQAAQPALLGILGLDTTADLTQLNPETAAAAGDPSFLIASAQVMDSAAVYAALVAAQTGVSSATAFAASFTAMAQQAATGTLNLQATTTTLVTLATAAAAIADPGFVLASGLAQDAAIILDNANFDVSTASGQSDPSAALTLIEAVEHVEQGQAAPQLAAAGDDQAAADNVTGSYSSGLPDAVAAVESGLLAAPVLAAASDTGVSAQDNLTSDTTPTFTGTAAPGATVFLVAGSTNEPGSGTVVGIGTADAGGAYAITATLTPGLNDVVAMQAAPGQMVSLGDTFGAPASLTGAQVTELAVGDLSDGFSGAPPTIQAVEYTASSANDATATSLYVTGNGSGDFYENALFTVTANGTPITATVAQTGAGQYGILTTPLAAGTYNLVVTETALDGETSQSAPYTVTVVAPGSLDVTAEAAGPVAGGAIIPYDGEQPDLDTAPQSQHPNATTDASGAASLPAQSTVPEQGNTLLYPTDQVGLQLEGGVDALTGLTMPFNLSAPPGSSVITPATSLLNQADFDAQSFEALPTATDYAYENTRIDTALGLPTTVDLASADPLATAESGDPTLFLKDIELLDTLVLLAPFTVDGDAGIDTAHPLYVIDDSLGIFNFEGFIGGKAPPVTDKAIDFTDPAEVLAWMTTYDSTVISGSYDTVYDPSVLPTAAGIIAASNAAIEAHAATATSLADTLSYALAVERVALSEEAPALAALASSFNFPVSAAQQQAGFATLQTAYTGPGLSAAVANELAQTVQVTSFTPAAASTGAAQETFTITFSAPVGGITAGDFTIAGDSGPVGAAVIAVAPVAESNGTAYTITVTTGVGDGTLSLDFTPNGLTNADGSPLATGTFGAPQFYASPAQASDTDAQAVDLATGDFTGSGHMDIVVASNGTDGLTLFLGQGDGSFVAEPAVYTGPTESTQVVTGDFNGDGKLDAVTLNSAVSFKGDLTVSTMLGNGDGTFAGPIQTDVGPSAVSMVAGDFNGDGKLDLAVLDGSFNSGADGSVQLFYGNGDGTFTAGSTVDIGAPIDRTLGDISNQMVEADLNGDGNTDLVIPTVNATTGVPGLAILLGNGQGGFTVTAQATANVSSDTGLLVTVGDLNGDGIPDIVAVPSETAGSETAEVLLGNGDGTFQSAISVPLALPPGGGGNVINGNDENMAVAVGDVTGDGKPDIVVENNESGLVVVPGNGDGTFGPAYTGASGITGGIGTTGLALSDVNGDGRLDLLATNPAGSLQGSSVGAGISVSLGTGQTVLPASASVTVDRAAEAQPALSETSGPGSLTSSGNTYTLNLGTLAQNSTEAAVLALVNAAAAPADSFDGTFSSPSGSGFTVTGATLAAAVAAGQSAGGLTFTADTSTLGSHSETITFAPRDATDDPGAAVTVPVDVSDGDDTSFTQPPADPSGDDVALELAPLTLIVTDDVEAGTGAAAPTIAGTVAGQPDSDEASITPFAAVVITDPNGGQLETVEVTPSAAANGTLSDPGAADDGSIVGTDGVFTVAGTAAQVSTILQDLTFTPTPHQVAPGGTVTTSFAITVSDTAGQTASDGTTSVIVTAADDMPVIGGISAGQAITDQQTVQPFAQVTLADPDLGAMLAATITLTAAGTATDADGTLAGTSLTQTGPGTYVLQAASPAAEQALLQALVFTPAAGSALTTTFALQVSNGTVSAANDATTVAVTDVGSAQPVVTLALVHNTGSTTSYANTSDDALTGSAIAGDTVTISNVGTVLGTAIADASGTYSFTPGGLADGAYNLTATDTDAGGTATASLSFTLDTAAPTLNDPSLTVASNTGATAIGITDDDNLDSGDELTATLTALPSDGTVSLEGDAVQTGQVLTGDQLAQLSFTPTAGLSNTSSTLAYTVTDLAGNAATGTATLGIGALSGSGSGDVHMTTFDGLLYDFQATGDFQVADAVVPGADDGFSVQMRAEAWNFAPDTSLAVELAAQVGQNVVRFGIADTPVTVNGASVSGLDGTSETVQLDDGTLTQTGAQSWLLTWNTGESLSVENNGFFLNFSVAEGPQDKPGTLQGLLGSDTGQANDFALPGGTVLPQPLSQSTILGQFADAWRVGAGQSLLDPPPAITPQPPSMTFLPPATVTVADKPGAIWTGGLGAPGPVEIQGASTILASGLLANLAPGDLIDLTDLSGATGQASYVNGAIQASDGSHSVLLPLAGTVPGSSLAVTSDAHGGLLLHI